jgi:hypothetical protein
MDNSILAGKYIYSLMVENEELSVLVDSDKIYPLRVELRLDPETGEEQEITFPFIIYSRTSLEPTYTKNFLTENLLKYTVIVVSDDYDNSLEVANAVRHALEGKAIRNEYLNICPIKLDSVTEETMEDTILQRMEFSFAVN